MMLKYRRLTQLLTAEFQLVTHITATVCMCSIDTRLSGIMGSACPNDYWRSSCLYVVTDCVLHHLLRGEVSDVFVQGDLV